MKIRSAAVSFLLALPAPLAAAGNRRDLVLMDGDGVSSTTNAVMIPIPTYDNEDGDDVILETRGGGGIAGYIFRSPIDLCLVGVRAVLPSELRIDEGVTAVQSVQVMLPAQHPGFPGFLPAEIPVDEIALYAPHRPIDEIVPIPGPAGIGLDVPAGRLVAVAADAGPAKATTTSSGEGGFISLASSNFDQASSFVSTIGNGVEVELDLFGLFAQSDLDPTGKSLGENNGPFRYYGSFEDGRSPIGLVDVVPDGGSYVGLVEVYYTVGPCGSCTNGGCGK